MPALGAYTTMNHAEELVTQVADALLGESDGRAR